MVVLTTSSLSSVADSEVRQPFSGCRPEGKGNGTYVVAVEVVNGGLGEHGVVLKLGLAQRRAVSGDEDQLGLARAESLHGGLGTHGN